MTPNCNATEPLYPCGGAALSTDLGETPLLEDAPCRSLEQENALALHVASIKTIMRLFQSEAADGDVFKTT